MGQSELIKAKISKGKSIGDIASFTGHSEAKVESMAQ